MLGLSNEEDGGGGGGGYGRSGMTGREVFDSERDAYVLHLCSRECDGGIHGKSFFEW